eukprot:5729525-Pyramimonas_sp.AAC.1
MQGSHWKWAVMWPVACSWPVSASTGDRKGSVRSRYEFHAKITLGMGGQVAPGLLLAGVGLHW